MTRLSALIVVLVIGGSAWAQTADPLDLAAGTPAENVTSGRVSARAPGTWVRAAIARHNEWMGLRVTGPRFGVGPSKALGGVGETSADQGATETTDGTTGGLGDLTGLLGSLGSLGDLTSVVTGLTGGSSTTTGTTDGMDPRLAALLELRDAAAGNNKSITDMAQDIEPVSGSDKADLTRQAGRYTFGGAIARLPKPEERFQDVQEERKFLPRLLESWTTTFLTALSVGFQSQDFIDFLKDALRPLILPPAASGTDTDGTTEGSDTGSSAGSGTGTSSEGGIENIPPPTDSTGDGGETII